MAPTLPVYVKQQVINLFEKYPMHKYTDIIKILKEEDGVLISSQALSNLIMKYRETGSIAAKPKCGRGCQVQLHGVHPQHPRWFSLFVEELGRPAGMAYSDSLKHWQFSSCKSTVILAEPSYFWVITVGLHHSVGDPMCTGLKIPPVTSASSDSLILSFQ